MIPCILRFFLSTCVLLVLHMGKYGFKATNLDVAQKWNDRHNDSDICGHAHREIGLGWNNELCQLCGSIYDC